MATIVVLLNRDLRIHDHPALIAAAGRAEHVVPLFVLDPAMVASGYASPNRLGFLLESLDDLRRTLRRRGADLVIRRGESVRTAMAVAADCGAEAVHASADVLAFADAARAIWPRRASPGG